MRWMEIWLLASLFMLHFLNTKKSEGQDCRFVYFFFVYWICCIYRKTEKVFEWLNLISCKPFYVALRVISCYEFQQAIKQNFLIVKSHRKTKKVFECLNMNIYPVAF